MITIDQLLESVDLDFEPRFVTKEKNGCITMWTEKPAVDNTCRGWALKNSYGVSFCPFGGLKLVEFDGKDWTECIYEVPRKTDEYEQNLEKLRPADSDLVYRVKLPRKTTGKIARLTGKGLLLSKDENGKATIWTETELFNKINELVEYVNALIESNNIHEKQIDELQMKLEPEKCTVNELKENKGE